MDSVIRKYNPGGVDRELLGATGRGGILSDGSLRDAPLESYLGSDERPVFLLSNGKHGVSYEGVRDEESGAYRPGDGYAAFALLTDSRLLFVVGDTEDGPEHDRSIAVPLVEVEIAEASDGILRSELVVRTAAGTRWRFPCRRDLDPVVSYLETASMTWMKVESRVETARTRLVEATQRLESGDYEAAMDAVEAAAGEVETARSRERSFCEAGVPSLDARIAPVEARIDGTRVEVLRARAVRRVDRAERRWREEAYEAAHEAYTAAREDYAAAIDACDGEEVAGLRERADRVERNLAELERAPLERADRTRERARETADPADRAALYDLALDRYRAALSLDWGREDKRFAGDTIELRFCIDAVATELVETRRELAAERALRATDAYAAGRYGEAAETYRAARRSLERARETASELLPGEVRSLSRAVAAVEALLDDPVLDGSAEGDVTGAAAGDESGTADDASSSPGRAPAPDDADGGTGHVTLRSP